MVKGLGLFGAGGVNGNNGNSNTSAVGGNFFTNSVWTGNRTAPAKREDLISSDEYNRFKANARAKAQKKVSTALARAKQEANKGVYEVTQNDSIDIRKYRMYESANHKTPVKSTAPYCASFVSWCYGNDSAGFGYEKYTPALKSKAVKNGCYTAKSKLGNGQKGTYKPKSGDLLMWINKNGQGGHVAMIEKCYVDKKTGQLVIQTIEGNNTRDPKGQAETATSRATGSGPEGVVRRTYTMKDIQSNPRMNGVVRMEDWLTKSEMARFR